MIGIWISLVAALTIVGVCIWRLVENTVHKRENLGYKGWTPNDARGYGYLNLWWVKNRIVIQSIFLTLSTIMIVVCVTYL